MRRIKAYITRKAHATRKSFSLGLAEELPEFGPLASGSEPPPHGSQMEVPDRSICPICLNLDPEKLLSGTVMGRQALYGSECYYCLVVVHMLLTHNRDLDRSFCFTLTPSYYRWGPRGPVGPKIPVLSLTDQERHPPLHGNFCLMRTDLPSKTPVTSVTPVAQPIRLEEEYNRRQKPARTPGAPECLAMARDAIATCFGQHDACPHFHETQLPTRLLDVGSEARHPKLFVTNGETGKYIALSHCWGKGKPLRLMKASFESFRNKILLADLPALFRDAVLLTRQLGVSYLWIDSLCIVQDDPSDWERESALMCNLYANAYVTIAVHTSKNGSESFLSTPRPASHHSAPPVCSRQYPGTILTFKQQYELSSLLGIPDTDYDARPLDYTQEERFVGCTAPWENSFLISRGWVLQERLISQRTLHYTEAGLIWECATAMFCECLGPVSQEPFERSWKEEEPKGLEGSLELWAHLVQWYTGLALTYESDRLIALAGLAARFEKQTDSRYICGVWLDRSLFHLANQWDTKMAKWCPVFRMPEPEDEGFLDTPWKEPFRLNWERHYTFIYQLHWFKEEPGAVERNTETCTSPSWSWASISGVVRLMDFKEQSMLKFTMEILNVQYVLATVNRFGPVKEPASLTARGLLHEADFQRCPRKQADFQRDPREQDDFESTPLESLSCPGPLKCSGMHPIRLPESIKPSELPSQVSGTLPYFTIKLDVDLPHDNAVYRFWLFSTVHCNDITSGPDWNSMWLLLRKRSDGWFERVGLCYSNYHLSLEFNDLRTITII